MKGNSISTRGASAGIGFFLVLLMMLLPAMPAAASPSEQEQTMSQEQTLSKVNINKADADAISQALKGVGKSKASAIVAYREQYGKFKSVDQLLEVKGIGKSTLERNRTKIDL